MRLFAQMLSGASMPDRDFKCLDGREGIQPALYRHFCRVALAHQRSMVLSLETEGRLLSLKT